jgi:HK97 family phage prohead protease
MDRLQIFGRVREIDADGRRVRVVAATGDVARDGAVIHMDGWVLSNYDRNPVVLWGHDDAQPPIARAVPGARIITENELIETHEFDDDGRSDAIWRKVVRGFVHAVSVRWLPIEWEWRREPGRDQAVLHFLRQELLEVSYVSVPADPGALILRADGGVLDLAAFEDRPAASETSPEPAPDVRLIRAAAIRDIARELRNR